MMNIVVLGASGQIGSLIFDHLRKDQNVTGTSRRTSSRYLRFDPFMGDWSVLGKPDVVINCVGQITATATTSFYSIHVQMTKRILENRALMGNPRIIQISALAANSAHRVEFLRTKGIADDLLLRHPNTCVIRPSIVCTHRTMIVRKMMMLATLATYTGGVVAVPTGFPETKIQPVMPDDLADVVRVLALGVNVAGIVTVAGAERLSFLDIITIMFKVKQKNFRFVFLPKKWADMLVGRLISFLFPQIVNSQQYQLLFDDNITDTNDVETLLGRKPDSTSEFFVNEFKYAGN